ncbi:MAG: hypothetical protein L6Q98_25080 [Anaerolineae bacterium]|nr:hypothetical protein [Anaerolineae bacterium]
MKRVGWVALAVMLALLVWAAPAAAQDGGTAAADGEMLAITWQGLAALIGIVLTVGLTGGVGGALLIIRAARQNEAITYAMERLYLSTPPATQEQIRGIVELIVEGGGLLEDVTDGEFAAESGLELVQRE